MRLSTTRRAIAVGAAMAALSIFASSGAFADHYTTYTESGTYDAATTPVVSVSCSPCVGFFIGGVNFAAQAPDQPISVAVLDASDTPTPFVACQDPDGDAFCEAGEPTLSGCGSAAIPSTFSANLEVLVFVTIADAACSGVGTTGTVEITYKHLLEH